MITEKKRLWYTFVESHRYKKNQDRSVYNGTGNKEFPSSTKLCHRDLRGRHLSTDYEGDGDFVNPSIHCSLYRRLYSRR